jgi:hypothetical protein
MLRFLDQRAPWVRPSDTGRSTNCLINAAGIHTHLTEQAMCNCPSNTRVTEKSGLAGK